MMVKRYKKGGNNWFYQIALVFKEIIRFNKKLIPVMIIEILISAASPFPYIILSKSIIDGLMEGVNFSQVVFDICLMFILNFILSTSATFIGGIKTKMSTDMTNNLSNEVSKKCMNMDYAMFNDTAMKDRAAYAANLAHNNNFLGILNGIKGIVSNAIILLGIIALVLQLDASLLVIALITVALQCTVYLINTKLNLKYDVEGVSINRGLQYVSQLPMNSKMKKDISVYNTVDFLLNKIKFYQKSWMKVLDKRIKSNCTCEWTTGIFSYGFQLISYILLGIGVFAKTITIGSFTMCINSLTSFVSASNGIVKGVVDINAKIYTVSRYNSFLKIRSEFRKSGTRKADDIDFSKAKITFENVSFKYPGSTTFSLKNINLTISPCEKVAVVGENGSGKTTFVLLLTRMYDPTEGRILLNGIDIKEIDYDTYLKFFSTVYQDFQIFPFSLIENVIFKDKADVNEEKKLLKLFEQNGLSQRLNEMYQGLNTPVTKELDNRGEDLSGGELQKIAIIRALYKNSPFIVLDEPTAALDPLAEYDIYKRFSEISDKKTVVYISHRIASTRFCDKIVVFSKGEICEEGTFNALIDRKGVYFDFYSKQAEYFE